MTSKVRTSERKRKSRADDDDDDDLYKAPVVPKRPKKMTPKQQQQHLMQAPAPVEDKYRVEKQAFPNFLEDIRDVMQQLTTHKYATPFLQPVDPILDGAPDYLTKIKRPMDFGTIQVRR
jgi:hypothetical protein